MQEYIIPKIIKDAKKMNRNNHNNKFSSQINQDFNARMKIVSLISQFKTKGKHSIDVIDLLRTEIPIHQIEQIMKQLEKEKIVKTND